MGWRCFLAAELPLKGVQSAADLIKRLSGQIPRGKVRWVDPAQLHLTLHFLGNDVGRETVNVMAAQGREIAGRTSPFAVTLEKLATLPPAGPARVIILPCGDPAGNLIQLRRAFLPTIASLGLPHDVRQWLPPVTLGRVKSTVGKLPELSATDTNPQLITMLTLYQSILTVDGPEYAKLAEFPLGSR